LKLSTHIAVGGSLAAAVALLLGCGLDCTWYAVVSAIVANLAVDMLGHESRPYPRRTRLSHSPVGPLLFSLPLLLPPLLQAPPGDALRAAASVLVGAYSHLLLDAVTEGGVYRSPFSGRRFRLASLPYNHPLLNSVAVLASAVLLLAVLAYRLLW